MDNYIVSARKYRPSTFRSVVGQKSLTTTLKNAIASNKLAHAYLFCGPRGVGKTSCARIFAKTINCLHPLPDGEACNECESCSAFNEQRSYNIHELDAASNNSVDDIRSLIEQVRIPPAIGKYKVFIIDEVHMLSPAAFNAFLKTLEEPPHHALFILATTEKHKVLPTILSRCQIYDFSRISVFDIVEQLEYIASQEGVTAEPEALNVIAQKADGGMRDALSIFDQVVSFSGGNITYQSVIANLNVLDYEYYFRLTDAMLEGNVRAAVLILNEILSKGFDGQNIITGLATHFRDLLVCKDEATLVLFEVGASIRERYKETAKRCSDQLLFKAIELANQCDLNYKISRNKRLLLELTLIQLCQLSQPSQDDSKKKRLIEPIDGPQGQPEQPQAPHQPAATAVQAPPAQPPAAPALHVPDEQPKKPGKAPVSTSLHTMLNKQHAAEARTSAAEATHEQHNPYTASDLTRCWDAYAQSLDDAYLKGIMVNCKPEGLENDRFTIRVHNPGQKDELLADSMRLLSYLREELKNTHVQMQISIDETNDSKVPYTSSDKYNHLLEINPLLSRLKDEFHLTAD